MSDVAKEIQELILDYKFPVEVLTDVNKRLADCPDNENYARQQLRFLKHIVAAGHVVKRTK